MLSDDYAFGHNTYAPILFLSHIIITLFMLNYAPKFSLIFLYFIPFSTRHSIQPSPQVNNSYVRNYVISKISV